MAQERLFELHTLDLKVADLQQKIVDGRKRVDNFKQNIVRHQQERERLSQQVKAAQVEAKELELDVEGTTEKKTKLEAKINRVATAREIEALQKDMQTLTESIAAREGELMEKYEQVEKLQKAVADKDTELKKRNDDLPKLIADIAAQAKKLEAEIAELQNTRRDLVGQMDATVASRYETARKANQGQILFEIRENACDGCGLPGPQYEWNRLRQNPGNVYPCGNCGRLLIYVGERQDEPGSTGRAASARLCEPPGQCGGPAGARPARACCPRSCCSRSGSRRACPPPRPPRSPQVPIRTIPSRLPPVEPRARARPAASPAVPTELPDTPDDSAAKPTTGDDPPRSARREDPGKAPGNEELGKMPMGEDAGKSPSREEGGAPATASGRVRRTPAAAEAASSPADASAAPAATSNYIRDDAQVLPAGVTASLARKIDSLGGKAEIFIATKLLDDMSLFDQVAQATFRNIVKEVNDYRVIVVFIAYNKDRDHGVISTNLGHGMWHIVSKADCEELFGKEDAPLTIEGIQNGVERLVKIIASYHEAQPGSAAAPSFTGLENLSYRLPIAIGLVLLAGGGLYFWRRSKVCPRCLAPLKTRVSISLAPGPSGRIAKKTYKCFRCGYSRRQSLLPSRGGDGPRPLARGRDDRGEERGDERDGGRLDDREDDAGETDDLGQLQEQLEPRADAERAGRR